MEHYQGEGLKAGREGYVGGGFKPFHAGHYALVSQALADGCDVVHLFVSQGKDREGLSSSKMRELFEECYIPWCPDKDRIKVHFSETSPVKDILVQLKLREMELIQAGGFTEERVERIIYADEQDGLDRFNMAQVAKFAPNLVLHMLVKTVCVPRSLTLGISGTQMRAYLKSGDKDSFLKGLPPYLSLDQRENIWQRLQN